MTRREWFASLVGIAAGSRRSQYREEPRPLREDYNAYDRYGYQSVNELNKRVNALQRAVHARAD